MLIRLLQITTRSSADGECLVRPFAGLFASFRFSPPTKRPAKSTWPLAAGPRATSAHDARTIAVTVGRRPWQCAACCQQVSLTSGTILHNTKTPLTLWFWAAYLMTTDKRGVSALLLHHQLGLQRYETAWMILHKLRRATVNAAREPLHGEVEIDDTWVGGTQAGLRGSRQLKGRRAALVVVAVEKRGRASGRTRMAVIPDFRATTINSFITQNVAPGSTIHTDGLKSFAGLQELGFKHIPRTQPLRTELSKGTPSVVPLADRAIGNLQQWLIGTHHGVSRAQLQAYLDEFVFRHNRRKQPMAAFQTLLGLGTSRTPTSYDSIRNPNI